MTQNTAKTATALYASVKLNDITASFATECYFGAHTKAVTFNPNYASPRTDYVWTGPLPTKAGNFIHVTPMNGTTIASMPIENVERGTGLNADVCAAPCNVVAEIDADADGNAMTILEGLAKLDSVVDAGVPFPSVIILSGDDRGVEFNGGFTDAQPGKSPHFVWAVSGLTEATRARAQRLILSLLDGDLSVGDITRKMRTPGFFSPTKVKGQYVRRVQTVLHAEKTVHTSEDFIAALESAVEKLGVTVKTAKDRIIKTARTGNVATTNGNTFDSKTTEVTLSNGASDTVANVTKGNAKGWKAACYCPFHNDGTASAFIAISDRGNPFIYCSSCGKSFHAEVAASNLSGLSGNGVEAFGLTFDAVERRAERFLSDIPSSKYVYIRSPRGTGKTTNIIRFLGTLNANARILIITHRRALVSGYTKALREFGFVDYREENSYGADRLVITLDSMPSVQKFIGTTPKAFDVVFIDESEQAIRHLEGDTIRNSSSPEEVIDSIRFFCRQASKIIASDADLAYLTVRAIRILTGNTAATGETLVINDDASALVERAAKVYEGNSNGLAQMDLALLSDWADGKVVAVYTSTRVESIRISSMLKTQREDAKILLVNRDTSHTKEAQDFIASPDAWIAANKPDAIIYSPSLGTGVDVSIKDYVDSVFAVIQVGEWTTTFDVLQGFERVRTPKSATRHLWIQERAIFGASDENEVYQQMVWAASTEREIAVASYAYASNSPIPVPRDEDTARILAAAKASRASSQKAIRKDCLAEMARLNWTVELVDGIEEAMVAEHKVEQTASKKAIKADEVASVLNADLISLQDAEKILKGDIAATPSERANARKTRITNIIGEATLTDSIVKDYLSGKLNTKLDSFLLLTNEAMKEAYAAQQTKKLKKTIATTPVLAINEVIKSTLSAFDVVDANGISLGACTTLTGGMLLKDAPRTTRALKKVVATLRSLGVNIAVASDSERFDFTVLSNVLALAGIKGSVARKSVRNGSTVQKETTGYCIDKEIFATMQELTEKRASEMTKRLQNTKRDDSIDALIASAE